ncbi:ATPase [Prauserella marina]|uniref:AAA domain (Dynein-related subfamily) n=1 Tax=Prauserella marina TaxID=530584 RepID=A0A222VJY6_9PSEU|nr:MoxR family ATPase [Prauserella marina]ASR34194.1 ATPase [Prauserella marina]PWV70870.1 dynein-related subfamily AAA family protein [Prauserella marina]SDE02033.1 AAA domain (dynein-related subfamily) [Prauserella marina]
MSERAGEPENAASLSAALGEAGYLTGAPLATALFLAVAMRQPILLEGEPGVGKTEAAKALAVALGTPLIRLQCYEGLAAADAIYEWNYPRQLLAIRLAEVRGGTLSEVDLFTDDYLLRKPLLAAIDHEGPLPAVVLVDEVDRADDEFEAFLLELLAEASVTIPELGTRVAKVPPIVVLTSNRTRELHDALKRRCLYHWIAHPEPARVAAIIRLREPRAPAWLAERVAIGVRRMRELRLTKPPGIAEAINWASALRVLGVDTPADLDEEVVAATIGAVLKYEEDRVTVEAEGKGCWAGVVGDAR